MIKEKFFPNKLAFITLLSVCGVVAISMGLRQTFGLFSDFFVKDLQSTVTQFGLAIRVCCVCCISFLFLKWRKIGNSQLIPRPLFSYKMLYKSVQIIVKPKHSRNRVG